MSDSEKEENMSLSDLSELSSEAMEVDEEGNATPLTVLERVEEFNKSWAPIEQQLSALLTDRQLTRPRDAPSQLTVAVQGEMGVGKSTLLNAILECDLLPSGSAGAVTACVCTIQYEAPTLPQPYRVVVVGLAYEEATELINRMKKIIQIQQEEDNGEYDYEVQDASNKFLKSVYGNLSPEEFLRTDDSKLLSIDHCRLVGSPGEQKGCSETARYATVEAVSNKLISLSGVTDESGLGFLRFVKRVEIHGPFRILRHRLVMMDLPGLGDIHIERSQLAKKHAKDADVLMLVGKVPRGADDSALIKGIHTRVITGTDDLKLIVALNKADTSLTESTDKLYLGQHDRVIFEKLQTKLRSIELKRDGYQEHIQKYEKRLETVGSQAKLKDSKVVEIRRKHALLAAKRQALDKEIAAIHRQKQHKLADGRSAQARKRIAGTVQDRVTHKTISPLRIFCLASLDYQKILENRSDTDIYEVPADTGVPALQEHLLALSEQSRIKSCIESLRQVDEYLSEFQPLRLELGENVIRGIRERAKSIIEQYILQIKEAIKELQTTCLAEGASIARKQCIDVFKCSIRSLRWNSLKALLRCDGIWFSKKTGLEANLNEDLVAPILQHVEESWDVCFNTKINALLEELSGKIQEEVASAFQSETRESDTEAVRELLKATSNHLDYLRQGGSTAISTAQRDLYNDGLANAVQNNLAGTYQAAGDMRGAGSRKRMETHVVQWLTSHADDLYTKLQGEKDDEQGDGDEDEDEDEDELETDSGAITESILQIVKERLDKACERMEKSVFARFDKLMDTLTRRLGDANDSMTLVADTMRTIESQKAEVASLLKSLEARLEELEQMFAP